MPSVGYPSSSPTPSNLAVSGSVAVEREAKPEGDEHGTGHALDRFPDRPAAEEPSDGMQRERVGGQPNEPHRDEQTGEQKETPDEALRRLDELREERDEEQGDLRIEDVRHHSL